MSQRIYLFIRQHPQLSITCRAWQNLQNGMCAQRRLRPALTPAQSDQSSLPAWRKLGSLVTHWAHSEDWANCETHPGWSESLMGAHAILLVLSWAGCIVNLQLQIRGTSIDFRNNLIIFSTFLLYMAYANSRTCLQIRLLLKNSMIGTKTIPQQHSYCGSSLTCILETVTVEIVFQIKRRFTDTFDSSPTKIFLYRF